MNKTGGDNITVKNTSELSAQVIIEDPDNDEITYEWQVIPESTDKKSGGDKERAPRPIKGVFSKTDQTKNKVVFSVPNSGEYRLFLFAKDGNGNVATGNIPFKVTD